MQDQSTNKIAKVILSNPYIFAGVFLILLMGIWLKTGTVFMSKGLDALNKTDYPSLYWSIVSIVGILGIGVLTKGIINYSRKKSRKVD